MVSTSYSTEKKCVCLKQNNNVAEQNGRISFSNREFSLLGEFNWAAIKTVSLVAKEIDERAEHIWTQEVWVQSPTPCLWSPEHLQPWRPYLGEPNMVGSDKQDRQK